MRAILSIFRYLAVLHIQKNMSRHQNQLFTSGAKPKNAKKLPSYFGFSETSNQYQICQDIMGSTTVKQKKRILHHSTVLLVSEDIVHSGRHLQEKWGENALKNGFNYIYMCAYIYICKYIYIYVVGPWS